MSDRPLRICHVAYTFYESDNRVIRYVETLAARGDRVDVVSLRRAGAAARETSGSVSFYRIQRRLFNEKGALSYLLKILWFWLKSMLLVSWLQLSRRYDVVHVHNVPDFLVLVAWLPKFMGARVILDIHDILPELYGGKFGAASASATFRTLVRLETFCCRFADHVIVANDLWYDKLTARSVSRSKCSVFLNYPDLTVFKPSVPGTTASDGGFLILYPGTLNHHQGVDLAIRAFGIARDSMPGAAFHIYGRGPALPELIRLAHDLQLSDRVHFMESVGLTEIAGIMASASVGVVPKRADGFGNEAFSTKILEFMACGVPVIVARTRIDAHYFNDTLVDFFTPGDINDLARALQRSHSERDGQRERVIAAEEFAKRYSWQTRNHAYRELVDSLAVGSPSLHSIEMSGDK